MLRFNNKRDFNVRDFIKLFVLTLGVNGITEISEKEIEYKLYPYKLNKQYELLFKNIYPKANGFGPELDLYEGLNHIKSWPGYVWWTSNDWLTLHVIKPNDETKKYMEEYYPEEHRLLMQELVSEYKLREEMEKKARYKLNIYGMNPNQGYSLVSGRHDNKNVTWEIITDGVLKKDEFRVEENTICFPDPSGEYFLIGIEKPRMRIVSVEGATFVIEHGKFGYDKKMSNLYTESLDRKRLELLTDYSTSIYTPESGITLTSEEPYVYQLKGISND